MAAFMSWTGCPRRCSELTLSALTDEGLRGRSANQARAVTRRTRPRCSSDLEHPHFFDMRADLILDLIADLRIAQGLTERSLKADLAVYDVLYFDLV